MCLGVFSVPYSPFDFSHTHTHTHTHTPAATRKKKIIPASLNNPKRRQTLYDLFPLPSQQNFFAFSKKTKINRGSHQIDLFNGVKRLIIKTHTHTHTHTHTNIIKALTFELLRTICKGARYKAGKETIQELNRDV